MSKKELNKRNNERDEDIFNLHKKGMSLRKLGEKYGVSSSRINQLYQREKYEREQKQIKGEK